MGRWGMRLFEADRDLDFALEINQAFGDSDDKDLGLSCMIHQTDMCCPQDIRDYYKTDDYKKELEDTVDDRCNKLNSGIGDELFKIFRKKEDEPQGKYRLILVGALMMRAGAVIKDDDFTHLRELVPEIPCRDGLHPALPRNPSRLSALATLGVDLDSGDEGFRHPGKVQFLAALENYRPGVPRSFQEPRSALLLPCTIINILTTMGSCYSCGKIAADNGEEILSQCSKCKRAFYCNLVGGRMTTLIVLSQGSS